MKLIALCGPAGCGKDTIADHLTANHGFVRYAFAGPLKDEVQAAYDMGDIARVHLDSRTHKEMDVELLSLWHCSDADFVQAVQPPRWETMTGNERVQWLTKPRSWRWVCQRWGTEYRRAQDDQYWLNKAGDFISAAKTGGMYGFAAKNNPKGVVITDCRFQNEADFVRTMGGELWHIRRPGIAAVSAHVSENALEVGNQDAMIGNVGTIDDLNQTVDLLMSEAAHV